MDISSRCMCYSSVLLAVIRPRLRPSCSARAPVSTVLCASIARSSWGSPSMLRAYSMAPVRTTILRQRLKRSLGALLQAPPRAYGWCRTRWSCATLAAQLQTKHGLAVSAWTVRRWLHEMDWVWKLAKLVAETERPTAGRVFGPGFGGMPSTCKRMRCWSLPMNSISICCPNTRRRGGPRGARQKS